MENWGTLYMRCMNRLLSSVNYFIVITVHYFTQPRLLPKDGYCFSVRHARGCVRQFGSVWVCPSLKTVVYFN